MPVHVIGIGQAVAGDDGVGVAVIAKLESETIANGVRYRTVSDPSALIDLLQQPGLVIVVDAVLGGGMVGEVLVLGRADLGRAVQPMSTHGVSVRQAIDLAAALAPDAAGADVILVGIVIDEPVRGSTMLSPSIATAVESAAAAVKRLIREARAGCSSRDMLRRFNVATPATRPPRGAERR